MSVAVSWANKMQLAKCDIMVSFPISSHICSANDTVLNDAKHKNTLTEMYMAVRV